jgi:N-acetylneuraminic acid mutarotase
MTIVCLPSRRGFLGLAAVAAATASSRALRAAPVSAWTTAARAGVARQELYPEVLDGRIYVAGGLLSPNTGYSAHFESYDPVADQWTRLATLPQARHHIALAAIAGRIYGVGGFSGGFPNWQAQADVYIYAPEADRWLTGVPLTQARAEGIVASVGDALFVIGGRVRASPQAAHFNAHEDTSLAEVFDVRTGRWSRIADAPTARNSAASAVIGGRIYVVGGRQALKQADGSLRQVNVATLEVFEPRTGRWQTLAPMPQAQGGLAAAQWGGRLYVFGGEQWVPTQKVFADSWMYEPDHDRWTPLPPLPTPRHGLGAAALNGRIHVFGGGLRVGGNAATDVHEVLRLGD